MTTGQTDGPILRARYWSLIITISAFAPVFLFNLIGNSYNAFKVWIIKYEFMRTGGLNEILKILLDNDNKGISNQELICLLQRIENDATEIYYAKCYLPRYTEKGANYSFSRY
jgi:hypothetical protein